MAKYYISEDDRRYLLELLRWWRRQQHTPHAPVPRIRRPISGGTEMFIAEVSTVATGGGYYNCYLQTLDATDWDSTTADQLEKTGGAGASTVVVLNLDEIGAAKHSLSAGDLIMCGRFTDDEGNARYVGTSCGNGKICRAKTQEAAQGDAYISVKLLNAAGSEVGAAFDATCIFTDGATAANTCLPDVATGKTVLISKIQGTWYIVNPTFTKFTECE